MVFGETRSCRYRKKVKIKLIFYRFGVVVVVAASSMCYARINWKRVDITKYQNMHKKLECTGIPKLVCFQSLSNLHVLYLNMHFA